jgi:hypothetical protein
LWVLTCWQMAYFQTKNPDFGNFLRVLQWKMYIIRPFGLVWDYLIYLMVIWYIFPTFSILYQEKYGNPAFNFKKTYIGLRYVHTTENKKIKMYVYIFRCHQWLAHSSVRHPTSNEFDIPVCFCISLFVYLDSYLHTYSAF